MCNQCNYEDLLNAARLDTTDNRIRVLEVIGNNSFPLSAADIYNTLERNGSINRVTVYRILDLLVEHELVDRISTGGRAFYYGMAPNANHHPHPHFYCKRCGQMDCLTWIATNCGKPFPAASTRWKSAWMASARTV